MGCQLNSPTARFRVWAPNAQRVRLTLNNAEPVDLAPEGSSGNWSIDEVPANANDKYQYIITTRSGPDNDTSQDWYRTDARALQVESSGQQSQGYVVVPFPDNRQPFTTPPFDAFLLYQFHIGSFAGTATTASTSTPTPLPSSTASPSSITSRGLGFNAICPLPITDAQNDVNGAGEGYGPCDMYASEDGYATSPNAPSRSSSDSSTPPTPKASPSFLTSSTTTPRPTTTRYWRYDGNCAENGGGGIYHVHGFPTSWGSGFAVWQQEVKRLPPRQCPHVPPRLPR